MIDTLLNHREKAERLSLMNDLGLERHRFAMLTLHRPSNVDERRTIEGIFEALYEISQNIPIIFPIHPRTKNMVEKFGLGSFFNKGDPGKGVWLTEPLSYLQFLHLNMNARLVLTDSGGLQEETTVLGVPCITLRFNTERPITCTHGTNRLVGNNKQRILKAAREVLNSKFPDAVIPEKWDGKAAGRIADVLMCDDRVQRKTS